MTVDHCLSMKIRHDDCGALARRYDIYAYLGTCRNKLISSQHQVKVL